MSKPTQRTEPSGPKPARNVRSSSAEKNAAAGLSKGKTSPKPARRGIQSIEIGFRILDYLRTTGRPVPLKEIAAGTGMTVANVHYYLVSFLEVGVVRQDADTGFYALGYYALKLGIAALEQFDVFTVARPVMAELAAAVGHTVFLGVWGNRGPTIVYRIEGGDSRPILEIRVGSVLPLLRSALGRNFLANLPRDLTRESLKQEMKQHQADGSLDGITDLPRSTGDVEKMLATVRQVGLSRCRDALLPHYTSLSAPIFDHTGFIIAAITLMGPVGVLDDDPEGPTARTLLERARQISREAGWTG